MRSMFYLDIFGWRYDSIEKIWLTVCVYMLQSRFVNNRFFFLNFLWGSNCHVLFYGKTRVEATSSFSFPLCTAVIRQDSQHSLCAHFCSHYDLLLKFYSGSCNENLIIVCPHRRNNWPLEYFTVPPRKKNWESPQYFTVQLQKKPQ